MAVRGQALGERGGERGEDAHGVADDAEMREVEDRRVLVGVNRHDQIRALDADAMLDESALWCLFQEYAQDT